MKIVERRGYPGPNRYARFPAVRLTVDLQLLDEVFTNQLGDFVDRLLAALPRLEEHRCSYGVPGGFVRRLREGTLLGHTLEHVAIALQNAALGAPLLSFGKTRSAGEPRHYHVVYATRDVADGIAAGDAAARCIAHCLPASAPHPCEPAPGAAPGAATIAGVIEDYIASVRARALGPSTAAIVDAAAARGIPCRRLDDRSLIELGHGRHMRRIRATITENTGCIAADLASDKDLGLRLLREAGLPVPRGVVVSTAQQAVAAAERIGYPVAVKPVDGNHGRGVRLGLDEPAAVRAAFEAARRVRDRVLVQAQLRGADHRLLVVGGRLVAAARRAPPQVVGDGARTIRALVAALNEDPRRGNGHETVLSRVVLDAEARRALAAQGLTDDSVPEAGRTVALAAVANLSRGGTAMDVTELVHRDNARAAERAAVALGLDVAGVDLIVPDIATSWRRGGGICEVNAAPGLRMHLSPSAGAPRDVGGAIVEMLFPREVPSHLPIAALTGTNGKTTTARMLARVQQAAGLRVGLCTTDGVYADGELLKAGDMTGPLGARMALSDPAIDSAVLEVARGGILRAGLGFDACDVGAVLNVSSDHLGFDGVETVSDMAFVKRLVVEVATRAAVLNADDPLVAAMAPYCRRARRIVWVGHRADSEIVRPHIAAGGTAVVLGRAAGGSEAIFLVEGAKGGTRGRGRERLLIRTADIPATLGGLARFNVDNAMFAAAMAVALGIPVHAIHRGLASFDGSIAVAPGRLNVYRGHPFTVVLDYGHNAAAYRALGALVRSLPVQGQRRVALGLPGNRRDCDYRIAAREAADAFDSFLLHDEDDRRGRAPLEVPRLFAEGLIDAGVPGEAITITDADAIEAVTMALERARPGDLLVVLSNKVEKAWEVIVTHDDTRRSSDRAGARA